MLEYSPGLLNALLFGGLGVFFGYLVLTLIFSLVGLVWVWIDEGDSFHTNLMTRLSFWILREKYYHNHSDPESRIAGASFLAGITYYVLLFFISFYHLGIVIVILILLSFLARIIRRTQKALSKHIANKSVHKGS